MTSWASFAEADDRTAQQPESEPEPDVVAERPPADVEDLAVGKLRLWLRGVFGGTRRPGD